MKNHRSDSGVSTQKLVIMFLFMGLNSFFAHGNADL